MIRQPLTIAWFSHFPVEWLTDVPEPVAALPRRHPAPWQSVVLDEFERNPELRLHVIVLRGDVARDQSFTRHGVRFHLLRTPDRFRARSRFWYDTRRVCSVVRTIRPDVVHAWGAEEGAAIVATRLGVPHMITGTPPMARHDLAAERLGRARVVTADSWFSADYLGRSYPALDVRHVEFVPETLFHRVVRAPEALRILSVGTTTCSSERWSGWRASCSFAAS